jgi:cell division protein ZapE
MRRIGKAGQLSYFADGDPVKTVKPSQKYEALMREPGFVTDESQQQALIRLDGLYAQLGSVDAVGGWRSWFSRRREPVIRGLYFWGGVGRGKTLLMDLFYQSLPSSIDSRRTHFHSLMNQIHASLRQKKNLQNPLREVAREIAASTRVLCLDEFVIIDIGDAMIMAGLLESLFAAGVVLVTTSNAAPRGLYRDGLQRARFVPAIELVETHCEVVNLDGGLDYRLRFLQQTDLYSIPHDATAEARIRDYLQQHVTPVQAERTLLKINGRTLAHQYCAEDTVWFSFAELCETTRSQIDYLELARFFNTVIVTDIRQMSKVDDDVARRFVLLIDVLYDHHVKLICSAAVTPDQLYSGKRLSFEFERSASRLIEMQSSEYLAQAHSQQ